MNYGIVEFNNTAITLVEQAQPAHRHHYDTVEYYYWARGIDQNGDEYIVEWDVINPDAEQQDEACDWDAPSSVTIY